MRVFISNVVVNTDAPNWPRPLTEMMKTAKKCMFATQEDFDMFKVLLKNKMQEVSAGQVKKLRIKDTFSGQKVGTLKVFISNEITGEVCVLRYTAVEKVLKWDDLVLDFFDISERLDKYGNI